MSLLYAELAQHLADSIERGILQPGDKLPGVRVTSANEGVSPATVVAAYRRLESDGYIEARPRSGFFVKPRLIHRMPEPKVTKPGSKPRAVTGQELVLQILQSINSPGVTQLGANVPNPDFLPTRAVSRALVKVANQQRHASAGYEFPPGLPLLRQQVARRMAEIGCLTNPDDIVITAGCQEAIYLALKTITSPGDVVAIESPTYYGLLQAIDSLGLKALEIPTDPATGISVEALELALEKWPVKAIVVVPNFSNPLGALMPDSHRHQLVDLINRHDTILIEDDIYGDTYHGEKRPPTLKSLDTRGNIIYCNSFSKSVSAGIRIGWLASEKLSETVAYHKFVTSCATSTLNQLTVSTFLQSGGFERHLRNLRVALVQNMARMSERVSEYFPENTRISRPRGGMALWIELGEDIDTTAIANEALSQNISIAPGRIFSTSVDKYRHCLRLNFAVKWDQETEDAVRRLGLLIEQHIASRRQ